MSVRAPGVHEIAARLAITEVLHRYCRAMDRMDRPLALSCWHPDGTDEHTPLYSGSAAGFVDWVWRIHEPMVGTRHCLSNVMIEVDGARAWSESYWDVLLRVKGADGLVDITGGGRYVDFLECREGLWAIVHRRSIHDWDRVDPVNATMADSAGDSLKPNSPKAKPYPPRRDRDDPSYSFLGGHQTRFPLL